jgi:hypothetical protein
MTSHDFGVFWFETIEWVGGCIKVDNAKLGALAMTLLNIRAWDVTLCHWVYHSQHFEEHSTFIFSANLFHLFIL